MTEPRSVTFRSAAVCHCGDHGFIGLTQGRVALFDPSDLPLISGRLWHVAHINRRRLYARSRCSGEVVLMHRLLGEVTDSLTLVDHFNHDGLDNRRANLRVCNHGLNLRNQRSKGSAGTPFKGLRKDGRKFTSHIVLDGREHHLGTFETAAAAARAYDDAAIRLHGEFALTNAAMGAFSGERSDG